MPASALPDAVISQGKNNLKQAWLARPTTRYGHGILGDAIEAGSLVTVTSCGHKMEFVLDEGLVFEDRQARIVDLEGDHFDEVVVVESSLDHGAALSVYGPKGATRTAAGGLKRIARTPFIGTRNRWLNPAGIADYDGDGGKEIAIVVTPHIGGTLQFWSLRDGELVLKAKKYGFSNHAIGSREQELSATVDNVLFLPDADRRTIMRVTLQAGKIEAAPVGALPSKVVGAITAKTGADGAVVLAVPTASDGVVELKSSN
ncbi:MAG: VCBS repeat-containing protein [Rhizobiales bacterium]|nr:VCBS repeat-containing protein [Hyphomicrobiales bacterium]